MSVLPHTESINTDYIYCNPELESLKLKKPLHF
jgi:hypothetical protein